MRRFQPPPSYGRSGWICDGPLRDGEAKNRTLVWWLDLGREQKGRFCALGGNPAPVCLLDLGQCQIADFLLGGKKMVV
jgi:hypothetical protein